MKVKALKQLRFKTSKGLVTIESGQICKPADPEKLISMGLAEPITEPTEPQNPLEVSSNRPYWQRQNGSCYACNGVDFWLSVHDVIVCSRCHPPAHDSLVLKWGHA